MACDLLRLYRFNVRHVWEGREHVDDAYMLMESLRHDKSSIWRAKQLHALSLLPKSDETDAKINEFEYLDWGITEFRLSELIDAVREGTFVTLLVNGNKGAEPPVPTHRPGGQNSAGTQEDQEVLTTPDTVTTIADMPMNVLNQFRI